MVNIDVIRQYVDYDDLNGYFFNKYIDEKTGKLKRKRVKPKYYKMAPAALRVADILLEPAKLAWYFKTGKYPYFNDIIHINGNIRDIRFENLRLDGEYKIGDTFFNEQSDKWQSALMINGERINLGLFYTKQEAEKALKHAMDKIRLYAK